MANGTRLRVWLVRTWRAPSGRRSNIWSALPWSAVMTSDALALAEGGDQAAEAQVDGLDREDRRVQVAGVADHVAVGEVDADEPRGRGRARRSGGR
jgi:hypothetical protein